jgi:hypothetical protein
MRAVAFAIAALAVLGFAVTNSYAAQFAFDPDSKISFGKPDNIVPIGIIVIASLVGAVVIALERRKAKGIWFSNNERMK